MTDFESSKKVSKSPRAMPYVLFNIFCERFCSAGISAILAFYFHIKLNLDENLATSVFHAHEFISYSFTIIGAIIADSWWGHYKTIVRLSLIYAFGAAVIAVGNIETLNLSILAFTIIGLVPMIVGGGSIRVNLGVFGANQYEMPEHASQLSAYFTIQYFMLKCGSVLGRLVLPILRQDFKCFEMNDCYPLTFGVTSLVMLIGFAVLMAGSSKYLKNPPGGNMFLKVFLCIKEGISGKFKAIVNRQPKKAHWLDYSIEKFGSVIVDDTKAVVSILVIFLPLPIYWAVYTQQGSRWVFQAARMNGDIGFYSIQPDQMILLNSILGILLIPVCDYVFYPLLARIGLRSPLQKMTIGGLLAGVAFVFSGFVEMEIHQNFISIFWLFPQYLVLALSENFLYIANITFAYKEAPTSMKSAMQAFIFMTIALGNLIVTFISGVQIFQSQSTELFFFAGVLFFDQIIFGFLAVKYKYKNIENKENI